MKNNDFSNLVIFEMANNHQGKIDHAQKIIRELGQISRRNTLNAGVKFQYRDLDTFIHPAFKNRLDVKHIPRFMSTRLSQEVFYELTSEVREQGMRVICTPFDEASVDMCLEHDVEILKIASCSAMDWPLLEKVSRTGRPVLISTGGKTFPDMDKIHTFMTHRGVRFGMFHCVGLYPVKNDDAQLNCISKMLNRYPDTPIGYSGHEAPGNLDIIKMAIAKGATFYERHVGLETEEHKLNEYSTDVNAVEKWVEAIATARDICGVPNTKNIRPEEIASLEELARGCYAQRVIKKGEILSEDDVFFAMPCAGGQTTSGQFQPGMEASRDYAPQEALYEKRKLSAISEARSIIHSIRGMLYEAHIVIGNNFTLELSHHYGLEHFKKWGVTIINIINREYCKKLLLMLPGQKHPFHYHKSKEESFQVLHGALILEYNDGQKVLKPGDIVTIMRGESHAFSSEEGCIFEEISTTHVKDDSFYEDKSISKQDLMQRKTILEDW